MRKLFSILAATIVVVALLLSFCSCSRHSNNLSGKEARIVWDEVNLRSSHTVTSEVLTSLSRGDKVTLTGDHFEYLGGDGSSSAENWVEVILPDNTTGWIVQSSVDWN